ncbi:hypothetical protein [Pseudobutyrivibrio ruminis]|uniref:Acetyltransferase (GNAT) domain-containing protein n=1 Tax=Pseudobutyrivibrio ruminis DSM 9787 TaxID=1123011 RepID=A0A285RRI5_9FIRM|nr:hypothetical protein [Pseudobutyrivibrio ruminis]SOB96729.1 hypothetical protein SAMN02910411_1164 [Pseudobutyrivibrio ruminis DSM 9787]
MIETRTIDTTNIADAIKIYNSNTDFLIHHLGEDHIDESFLKNELEEMIRNSGAQIIRIDVVDDYENNVLPFWEKMGFEAKRRDELTWGNKKSSVSVMEKVL